MSRLIYLDNAATTQVYPEVVDAMLPYFTEHYGNPSAIYSFADEAERAVDHARGEVADLIGAKKDEIYFTGGGSESDNWALKATAEAYAAKGKHIITSAIEHHAILHTAQWLEKHGFEVTYVGVDEDGKIKLDELKAAKEKLTTSAQQLFTKMYENMQQAQGGQAGPDMSGMGGQGAADAGAGAGPADDVVDGDYREV